MNCVSCNNVWSVITVRNKQKSVKTYNTHTHKTSAEVRTEQNNVWSSQNCTVPTKPQQCLENQSCRREFSYCQDLFIHNTLSGQSAWTQQPVSLRGHSNPDRLTAFDTAALTQCPSWTQQPWHNVWVGYRNPDILPEWTQRPWHNRVRHKILDTMSKWTQQPNTKSDLDRTTMK